MSNGEIIQAAPYHHLLSSSQEFQDLVNAHKETAGSNRLVDVSSSKGDSNTATEISKIYMDKQFETSQEGQLIKKEEDRKKRREEGSGGEGHIKDLLDVLLDIHEDENSDIKLTKENIKAFILVSQCL